MKTTEITCKTCGKIVSKSKYEINRQLKKGRTEFYCNLKCAGKDPQNIKHLTQFRDNFVHTKYTRKPDEFSDFKWYMKNIVKNSKKKNQLYDVDLPYLKNLWEKQCGICPMTKEKIELRTHTSKNLAHPYSASLDRIDSSKGYIKGNVRFVALIFNYAKNTFSDSDVLNFCNKIVNSAK